MQSAELSPERILQGLETRTYGRSIRYAEQMPSTNLTAKELVAEGCADGMLVVCNEQTKGRGRMDRRWETPAGTSLTVSLIQRPKLSPEMLPLLTMVCAAAAVDAIHECCGIKAGIKWPNDVVTGRKKCAGILCETVIRGNEISVITGMGINVSQTAFPEELSAKATSLLMALRENDPETANPSRARLLRYWLKQMEYYTGLLETEGAQAFLTICRSLSVTIGQTVQVIGASESFTGVAEDIDGEGALLIRDDSGMIRRVLCGDVSVRGLMGYC